MTKDLSKNYSLLNDIDFEKSRQTLKAARKSLKQLGKGNRPNAADSITDAEIEKLWSSQALGDHSPKNLQMTIWFCLCIHMGMRGRDEHHKYRFGDFTLKFSSEGHEYVEFTQERGTKTRSGEGEAHQQRAFKPKMFATPACPDRCPVKLFKTFISHRPEGMNLPESPFYLAVNQKLNEHSKWYKCQPLGIHQINGFMKTLSEVAELPGRKTNHSARKTTVQKLCNSGIPSSTVLQVSGHRNVHSLNNYKKPSIEQQQSISHLLSCYSTQPNPSTSIPILSSTYNSTMTDITNQQSQNGGVIMPGCTLHSCTIQIISSPCGPLTKKPKMDSP